MATPCRELLDEGGLDFTSLTDYPLRTPYNCQCHGQIRDGKATTSYDTSRSSLAPPDWHRSEATWRKQE